MECLWPWIDWAITLRYIARFDLIRLIIEKGSLKKQVSQVWPHIDSAQDDDDILIADFGCDELAYVDQMR
jgi:hypothetical protein